MTANSKSEAAAPVTVTGTRWAGLMGQAAGCPAGRDPRRRAGGGPGAKPAEITAL